MSVKTKKAEAVVPVKKGWRIKQYYINLDVFNASKAELAKAPNQVQIMVNHFASAFNSAELAGQGKVLCQSAIDNAGLKTVIEPNVLFAYYRSTMEQYGLTLKV